jgi:hypothetical protein
MNTTQEIIKTVQKLPLSEQEKVLEALQGSLQRKTKLRPEVTEDDVEKLLLAEGVISEIPNRSPDDEEETYEPITVKGNPLSEMILENREQ